MGNVHAIYDNKCLDYHFEEAKDCMVYQEHQETVKYLNQMGKIFEENVYQNFNANNLGDGTRISWYQLMGQSIKGGGQEMSMSDPFRKYIITTGKCEKLIGQMEDEFTGVCNNLILQPIQELRSYCGSNVQRDYVQFLESYKRLKIQEHKASSTRSSIMGYQQIIDSLNEHRDAFRNAHIKLHNEVIYVYETLVNLKVRVPAMLEHQRLVNLYSTNYINFLLNMFRENKSVKKQIIPLTSMKSLSANVPDFRPILGDSFPKIRVKSKQGLIRSSTDNQPNQGILTSGVDNPSRQSYINLNMQPPKSKVSDESNQKCCGQRNKEKEPYMLSSNEPSRENSLHERLKSDKQKPSTIKPEARKSTNKGTSDRIKDKQNTEKDQVKGDSKYKDLEKNEPLKRNKGGICGKQKKNKKDEVAVENQHKESIKAISNYKPNEKWKEENYRNPSIKGLENEEKEPVRFDSLIVELNRDSKSKPY